MLSFNKSYVVLEGTFDMNNKGHESAYCVSIAALTYIKALNQIFANSLVRTQSRVEPMGAKLLFH